MEAWLAGTLALFERYGLVGIFIWSFVEASFFPIPPYILLIPLTLANPRMGLIYATVGTAGSVLGGFLGYVIGLRLGRPVLAKLLKPETLTKLERFFGKYGGWAIAIGGVTPIPYKFFTIAAGVFRVRILTFIPTSIIARSLRFFGEATLLIVFGPKIVDFLEGTLGPTNLLILVVLAVAIYSAKKMGMLKWLTPILRKAGGIWTNWADRVRNTVEPAGQFGWYLLTGATLLSFGFLVFAKLVDELLELELVHFDRAIASWIIGFRVEWLNNLMIGITNIGSTFGIIGVALLLTILGILLHRRVIDIVGLDLCVLGGWGLSEFLKALFHRTRPPHPWLTQAPGYSFPSGHALISLTLYGFLAYYIIRHTRPSLRRNLSVFVLLLIPFMIGISRIYLGVHFPSDVLGGWAVAGAWVNQGCGGLVR
ncbi:MAG TPA: phosphatase PAP2 family protein [Bacillota bacterium]|nr:phosphatase PAP2 family protein [Bacillota bacterium]